MGCIRRLQQWSLGSIIAEAVRAMQDTTGCEMRDRTQGAAQQEFLQGIWPVRISADHDVCGYRVRAYPLIMMYVDIGLGHIP